jgi:CBS domain-containing protein
MSTSIVQQQQLLRLTHIVRCPLVDQASEPVGHVDDLVVRLGSDRYPPVVGLKVRIGGRHVFVPINWIAELSAGQAQMTGATVNLLRFERRESEVLLRQDILDRKVIQMETGRLIPACDIALSSMGNVWRVAGIDVRSGSILQKAFHRSAPRPLDPATIVDWSRIEPFVAHVPTAKLRLPLLRLKRLHPAQLADLVEGASHDEGTEIITAVGGDPVLEADVFEELDTEHQREFLQGRSDTEAAAVIGGMSPDDAADLIGELPQERRAFILARVPMPQQARLRALLAYNPSTAGGLMTTDYVAVAENGVVEQVVERVAQAATTILAVYVTDTENRLLGSISLQALLRAARSTCIRDVAEPLPVRLPTHADFTNVAMLMADYNLTEAPVVDDRDHLVGVISVDDVLESLIPDDWRRREEASAD